jgi:hypothetical protein
MKAVKFSQLLTSVSMPVLHSFSEDGDAKRAVLLGRQVFIHGGASLSTAEVLKARIELARSEGRLADGYR